MKLTKEDVALTIFAKLWDISDLPIERIGKFKKSLEMAEELLAAVSEVKPKKATSGP